MFHVHDEEWVDAVRGTLPGDRAAEVAAHLETGCARCLKARELWLAVAGVAGSEHLYQPPADALRIVRAAFDTRRTHTESLPLRAVLAFDSLMQAGMGVRGGAAPPRHLLYQAGALFIDLRFVASRGSARHVLIGQVANAEHPGERCGGCQIDVFTGDHATQTTAANDLGEFEVEVAPEPQIALLVTPRDHRPVHIPLGDALSGR
jgi:hypothetical protein